MCAIFFSNDIYFFAGHECLDVRFEDPSSGFFLREANVIHSQLPTTTTNIEDSNGSATTSIILGATTSGLGSKEIKSKDLKSQGFSSAETTSSSGHLGQQRTSKAASFGDILHSER